MNIETNCQEIFLLTGVSTPCGVSVVGAAQNAKENALAIAGAIRVVHDAETLQKCVSAQATLAGLRKWVTAEHARVKAPILDITRQIDAQKRDFVTDIEAEERRLGAIAGAHQAVERAKAEAARREAERIKQVEIARIAAEAEAAESARIAREHREGRTGTLVDDIDTIRKEEAAQIVQAEQVAVEAVASAAVIAPAGTILRKVLCFDVTDIHALYAARPELVKLEVNRTAVTGILKNLNPGQSLPGIKHWFEAKSSVKSIAVSTAQITSEYGY